MPAARPRSPAHLGLLALAVAAVLLVTACDAAAEREIRSDAARAEASDDDLDGTVQALNTFAFDLHRQIVPTVGNVAHSPYAVAETLAMSRAGAAGVTAEQLDAVLHAELSPDLDAGFNDIDLRLSEQQGEQRSDRRKGEVRFDLIGSLWTQRDTRFEEPFLDVLARFYGTGVRVADFRSDPESSRTAINRWAASGTEGRISDLVRRGSVTEFTRFVLPSAASLRAPWTVPFDPEDESGHPFTLLDGREVDVPMLHAGPTDGFRVAEGDGWRAVAVPYLGNHFAMLMVVPDPGAFASVEADLDAERFEQILDGLRPEPVDLTVPRFQFTSEIDLEGPLRALGLTSAFTDEADFSGITLDEPLSISRSIHQSFASIDEEGTDADASIGVPAPAETVSRSTQLLIDRPFLFAVIDQDTGLILQLGRVLDPFD
jgi:serpin B